MINPFSYELLLVLRAVRERLVHPDADFTWSSWQSVAVAVSEVDGFITALEGSNIPQQDALMLLFAPTGPLQEVSLSSGWGEEFVVFATRVDHALAYSTATSPQHAP